MKLDKNKETESTDSVTFRLISYTELDRRTTIESRIVNVHRSLQSLTVDRPKQERERETSAQNDLLA